MGEAASFFGWFRHIAQDLTPPIGVGGAHIMAEAKNQAVPLVEFQGEPFPKTGKQVALGHWVLDTFSDASAGAPWQLARLLLAQVERGRGTGGHST